MGLHEKQALLYTYITLREVQVPNRQIGALDKNRKIAARTSGIMFRDAVLWRPRMITRSIPGKVLDLMLGEMSTRFQKRESMAYITITAVLSSRDCSGAFLPYLFHDFGVEILSNVRSHGVWRKGNRRNGVCVRGNQRAFALVPSREQFGGGSCADQPRVCYPGKTYTRDVSRRGVYSCIWGGGKTCKMDL